MNNLNIRIARELAKIARSLIAHAMRTADWKRDLGIKPPVKLKNLSDITNFSDITEDKIFDITTLLAPVFLNKCRYYGIDISYVNDMMQEMNSMLIKNLKKYKTKEKKYNVPNLKNYLIAMAQQVACTYVKIHRLKDKNMISPQIMMDDNYSTGNGLMLDEEHSQEYSVPFDRNDNAVIEEYKKAYIDEIAKTDKICAEVMRLHIIEGMTEHEIAKKLNISQSYVNKKKSEGLEKIQNMIRMEGGGLHVRQPFGSGNEQKKTDTVFKMNIKFYQHIVVPKHIYWKPSSEDEIKRMNELIERISKQDETNATILRLWFIEKKSMQDIMTEMKLKNTISYQRLLGRAMNMLKTYLTNEINGVEF